MRGPLRKAAVSTIAVAWLVAGPAGTFVAPACGHGAGHAGPPMGHAGPPMGHAGGMAMKGETPPTPPPAPGDGQGSDPSHSGCGCQGAMCCPPTLGAVPASPRWFPDRVDGTPAVRVHPPRTPPARPCIFAVPLPQPPPLSV